MGGEGPGSYQGKSVKFLETRRLNRLSKLKEGLSFHEDEVTMRPLHLAPSDLQDGTSSYWAFADNVLSTHEMARIPLTLKNFKELLALRVLFSKHTVAPGICYLKNRHLRTLVEKHDFGILFQRKALVPLLTTDSFGFRELEQQDRQDSTSYRVKQDAMLSDFAVELDMVTTAAIPLEIDNFRADLTERYERFFLNAAELRRLNLQNERNEIKAFLQKQRAASSNGVLRRSSFFFLGDQLLGRREQSGYNVKTKASGEYHDSLANEVGLQASKPDLYGPQQTSFPNFAVMAIPNERICFLSLREIARLNGNEIITLRNSQAGERYFQAAFNHLRIGSDKTRKELDEAVWRYAVHIKEAIVSDGSPKCESNSVLRFTGKGIKAAEVVLPFAVATAHHYVDAGAVLWYGLAFAETGLVLAGKLVEKTEVRREKERILLKVAEWDSHFDKDAESTHKILI